MNGTIDFLLDTNYVLALVKGDPALSAEKERFFDPNLRFGISVISRIELLGFPDLTEEEEARITETLNQLRKVPLTQSVEDRTIEVRRSRKLELPDALILATALECGSDLLTLDGQLRSAFGELKSHQAEER
jgi:hypothetical protein